MKKIEVSEVKGPKIALNTIHDERNCVKKQGSPLCGDCEYQDGFNCSNGYGDQYLFYKWDIY